MRTNGAPISHWGMSTPAPHERDGCAFGVETIPVGEGETRSQTEAYSARDLFWKVGGQGGVGTTSTRQTIEWLEQARSKEGTREARRIMGIDAREIER